MLTPDYDGYHMEIVAEGLTAGQAYAYMKKWEAQIDIPELELKWHLKDKGYHHGYRTDCPTVEYDISAVIEQVDE